MSDLNFSPLLTTIMNHLTCTNCKDLFNTEERQPLLLPTCGHSVCVQCMSKILQDNPKELRCPEDGQPCDFYNQSKGIKSFPLNRAVLKAMKAHLELTRTSQGFPKPESLSELERKDSQTCFNDFCFNHKQKFSLICFTEKKLICADCALFGDHKDHEFMKIDLYRDNIKDKFKSLAAEMEGTEKDDLQNINQQEY